MISPVPPKARKEFCICIFWCRALTGNMALFSRSIRPDCAFKTLIEAIKSDVRFIIRFHIHASLARCNPRHHHREYR
ncbi:Uncharacterised protein [Klebsiella quasipneumoniae]|uniref:Secreted protein n=1 Tax=Klebsiella quasipneumoniae TaxID=1463165 RepID=A0ABD7N1R2_9ENTR|nr:Uncharacterised protein [Klebsiella quasipneumoniae]